MVVLPLPMIADLLSPKVATWALQTMVQNSLLSQSLAPLHQVDLPQNMVVLLVVMVALVPTDHGAQASIMVLKVLSALLHLQDTLLNHLAGSQLLPWLVAHRHMPCLQVFRRPRHRTARQVPDILLRVPRSYHHLVLIIHQLVPIILPHLLRCMLLQLLHLTAPQVQATLQAHPISRQTKPLLVQAFLQLLLSILPRHRTGLQPHQTIKMQNIHPLHLPTLLPAQCSLHNPPERIEALVKIALYQQITKKILSIRIYGVWDFTRFLTRTRYVYQHLTLRALRISIVQYIR